MLREQPTAATLCEVFKKELAVAEDNPETEHHWSAMPPTKLHMQMSFLFCFSRVLPKVKET